MSAGCVLTIRYAPVALDLACRIEAELLSAGLRADTSEDRWLPNVSGSVITFAYDKADPDLDYAMRVTEEAIDRYRIEEVYEP